LTSGLGLALGSTGLRSAGLGRPLGLARMVLCYNTAQVIFLYVLLLAPASMTLVVCLPSKSLHFANRNVNTVLHCENVAPLWQAIMSQVLDMVLQKWY